MAGEPFSRVEKGLIGFICFVIVVLVIGGGVFGYLHFFYDSSFALLTEPPFSSPPANWTSSSNLDGLVLKIPPGGKVSKEDPNWERAGNSLLKKYGAWTPYKKIAGYDLTGNLVSLTITVGNMKRPTDPLKFYSSKLKYSGTKKAKNILGERLVEKEKYEIVTINGTKALMRAFSSQRKGIFIFWKEIVVITSSGRYYALGTVMHRKKALEREINALNQVFGSIQIK